MIIQNSDLIGIVGIHATIVSIIIATASTMAALLYAKALDKKAQIYDLAFQGNNISFSFMILYKGKQIKNSEERAFYVERFTSILAENYELSIDPKLQDLKEMNEDKRVEEFFNAMASLSKSYPFRSESNFSDNSSTLLQFNSLEEIEKWANLLYELSSDICSFYSFFYGRRDDLIEKAEKIWAKKYIRGKAVKLLAEDFYENMRKANKLASDINQLFIELNAHKRKYSVENFTIPIILAALAFLFGGVIPLFSAICFEQNVNLIFLLLIPFLIYFVLFIYLLYVLCEKIME